MNCTEIRPLLSAYFDGEATPEEHRKVESHLAGCEDCRRVLAEYRAIGGGIRALPAPLPPAGLRRDVWRAIETHQTGHNVPNASPGKNVTVLKRRERERAQDTWRFPTPAVGGWGKALPALGALAAVLVIFVAAMAWINNRPQTAFAAAITDPTPIADYSKPLHVQFQKAVNPADARAHTTVRVQGAQQGGEVEVTKTFENARNMLVITPKDAWEAGVKYEVWVDAPRIGTGVAGGFLADQPFALPFDTVAYTPTPTNTPQPTNTPEPTRVAELPTETAVPVVQTPAAQESPTAPPATATNTEEPTTATPTEEPSNTPAPTKTATEEPTDTPAPKPTGTATASATAPAGTPTARKGSPTPRTTVTPKVTPTAIPPCPIMPVNGFGKLWREHADVRSDLGCPSAEEIAVQRGAQQHFQGGYMFWRGDTGKIFVFLGAGNSGTWDAFDDTWKEGDPEPVETPPQGLYAPVRGFGKVWRTYPALRQALGWATGPETGMTGAWQPYAQGNMLWTTDRVIRVLYDDNTWAGYPDTFVWPTATATPRRPGE